MKKMHGPPALPNVNNGTKPTLAAGMARRAFWIAVAGGWAAMLSKFSALALPVQAILTLLAIALLLIAATFGAVALIRITAADRKVVLIPALGGLLLALALLANLSYATRDRWVKARMQQAQTQSLPTTPPLRAPTSPTPKSTFAYALPALEDIPAETARLLTQAKASQGDDAAVLRAWTVHLGKIYAAYTNTWLASNQLHAVDLLDPKLISTFDQDEPVRRRRLANQYSDAWRALDERLSTLTGAYSQCLHEQRVSAERAYAEGEALFAAAQQPEMTACRAALQKLCKAGQDVGRHYNYAVSAVYTYAQINSKSPNASQHYRAQMDQQISKLREVEQAAVEIRSLASAPATSRTKPD
jgi:hypothetical protein